MENDIAVLKVRNPEDLTCTERHIWPACLPDKVTSIDQQYIQCMSNIDIHNDLKFYPKCCRLLTIQERGDFYLAGVR